MHAIASEPAAALPREVPAAARAITERALEKDPARRYQTMRDLAADLRRAMHPTSAAAVAAPMPRRRWRLAAIATAAALAILVWLIAAAGPLPGSRRGATVQSLAGLPLKPLQQHATYLNACVSALGGDVEGAVHWLHETVDTGLNVYPAFARDRCFDRIRQTAPFTRFMTDFKPIWEGYERQLR
jgi:hypothetical protein